MKTKPGEIQNLKASWFYAALPLQAKFQKQIIMRNNTDNVVKYLAKGIPSAINADEYEYHELVRLAKLARSCETALTVSVGIRTMPETIEDMARDGKEFIRLDWRQ